MSRSVTFRPEFVFASIACVCLLCIWILHFTRNEKATGTQYTEFQKQCEELGFGYRYSGGHEPSIAVDVWGLENLSALQLPKDIRLRFVLNSLTINQLPIETNNIAKIKCEFYLKSCLLTESGLRQILSTPAIEDITFDKCESTLTYECGDVSVFHKNLTSIYSHESLSRAVINQIPHCLSVTVAFRDGDNCELVCRSNSICETLVISHTRLSISFESSSGTFPSLCNLSLDSVEASPDAISSLFSSPKLYEARIDRSGVTSEPQSRRIQRTANPQNVHVYIQRSASFAEFLKSEKCDQILLHIPGQAIR